MKLAANVSLLYTECDEFARIEQAAQDGFDGIEILFPYDTPAGTLRGALQAAGLPFVLLNAPAPTADPSERGMPAESGQFARFREKMLPVLEYSAALDRPRIHLMPGYAQGPDAHARFMEALAWVCDQAPEQHFTLEPLNPVSQPNYFLNDYGQAVEIIDELARENLGLQYDTFHAQMIHGDAAAVWHRYKSHATHIQLGQAPNRSEPSASGPVDFAALAQIWRGDAYDGWISAEYNPTTSDTRQSLDWMALFR